MQVTLASLQKNVDLIQEPLQKSTAQNTLATAQASAGDIAGAQATATISLDPGGAVKHVERVQSCEIIDVAGLRDASDHLPVKAIIALHAAQQTEAVVGERGHARRFLK